MVAFIKDQEIHFRKSYVAMWQQVEEYLSCHDQNIECIELVFPNSLVPVIYSHLSNVTLDFQVCVFSNRFCLLASQWNWKKKEEQLVKRGLDFWVILKLLSTQGSKNLNHILDLIF